MVEVNYAHRRPTAVVCLRKVRELSGWRREDGDVVLGAGHHLHRDHATRALPTSCLDSPRRRARSARPRSATPARSEAISERPRPLATRCRCCPPSMPPSSWPRRQARAVTCARRARRRPEAHPLAPGRDHRRGPAPGQFRLAGVLEGRHPQRHGHRGRERGRRRRLGGRIGPVRSRLGRPGRDPGAPRPSSSSPRGSTGRNERLLDRRRLDRVHDAGAGRGATHRRPPLDGRLSPTRRRGLRRAGARAESFARRDASEPGAQTS